MVQLGRGDGGSKSVQQGQRSNEQILRFADVRPLVVATHLTLPSDRPVRLFLLGEGLVRKRDTFVRFPFAVGGSNRAGVPLGSSSGRVEA